MKGLQMADSEMEKHFEDLPDDPECLSRMFRTEAPARPGRRPVWCPP